jgi:hypothetical protein
MATKTQRFELRAKEGFIEELDRLATASGTSKADIIDRAVNLYARAWAEAEEGKVIQYIPAQDAAQSELIRA